MTTNSGANPFPAHDFVLDFSTPRDPALQSSLEKIDATLRARHGMTETESAAGIVDLRNPRLAVVRPDTMMYAASLPKIAILLAYFAFHPEAAASLNHATRRELGLMIKASNNEIAAKYSEQLGLKRIQHLLISLGLYDPLHGGGIWIGKHYGKGTERFVDPVGSLSHGATIRQLLRFYLLMEQGKLVSPQVSSAMRDIFASPGIPHIEDKFVAGLRGRPVTILRKAGWWEDWFHDTGIITGPGRHYILAAMTHHSKGEQYLRELVAAVDDGMTT